MVTLVSGLDDDLGQGRELGLVYRRRQVGMFQSGDCQTRPAPPALPLPPTSQGGSTGPRHIRLGLESPGTHQGKVGQGVKGTMKGRVSRIGAVPTARE